MKKILFFALLATSYLTFNAFKCSNLSLSGNGKYITKELSGLKDFDSISDGIAADIELIQGNEYKVVYQGDDNLLENISIKVENKSLNFENKRDYSYSTKNNAKFIVTMPILKEVALGGSGTIYSKNNFDSDKIRIALGGSGDIKLKGKAQKQEVALGGSGDVDLSQMIGEKAKVSIAGSGDVDVNVSEQLEVTIAGSGDVNYQGNPQIKETVVGSGSVNKKI
jgi:Putative auto-transporter adhesin, head GIN domain